MICSIRGKFYASSPVFRSSKLKYIMYWTKWPIPSNSSPIQSIWPRSHLNHYRRAFIPGFQSQKSRGRERVRSLMEKQNTSQRKSLRKENWRNPQLQKPKHVYSAANVQKEWKITGAWTVRTNVSCRYDRTQGHGAVSSLYLHLQIFSSTTCKSVCHPFPKIGEWENDNPHYSCSPVVPVLPECTKMCRKQTIQEQSCSSKATGNTLNIFWIHYLCLMHSQKCYPQF